MLHQPLPHLAAWTAWLEAAPIPVQAGAADEIELLAQAEALRGDVDAHQLRDPVEGDPLMALRLMAWVSQARKSRSQREQLGSPETVTAALVMMGVGPFFRAFTALPTVESILSHEPEALAGLRRVIRRAYRASNFALGFAVHRMDNDAEVLKLAALLHDFTEMLLWCHAPSLALEIARRQAADTTLRSTVAQQAVLNVELHDLQQALMRSWALPDLLVHIADDSKSEQPQVQNVQLAIRLARHTEDPQRGWDNPAVPDDLTAIGKLLNLSPAAARQLVIEIDT